MTKYYVDPPLGPKLGCRYVTQTTVLQLLRPTSLIITILHLALLTLTNLNACSFFHIRHQHKIKCSCTDYYITLLTSATMKR